MCTVQDRVARRLSTARLVPAYALLLVLAGRFAFGADEQNARDPWDTPFSADAASLRKAANAIPAPEGKAYEVLLRDVSWTIDASGRTQTRDRTVVRLLNEAGAREWASIEQTWAPWYQEKPSIRARVIGSDGVAHELDVKTIAEAPAGDESEDTYSDRRISRAPLPTLSAGAIVEQEIEIAESAPLLDAGVLHALRVIGGGPVRRVRFRLAAPSALPLQWTTHGIARDAVRREEDGGTVRLSYEGGPFAPFEDWESGMPEDARPAPLFSFSTARSWHEIAVRYAAIVDERIAAGNVDAILREAFPAATTASPDLAQVATRLHAKVRYTGVEFGEAAVVPAPPVESWNRGYGDCKDKAVLLVALLRAAGTRANVALLNSGFGRDVDSSLPGFSGFNHAIVVVEGKERIWIDATDPLSRPGQLPLSDQGRLALIASPDTKELVRIPRSGASANQTIETREFFLAEHGSARLVVTQEATGTRESGLRSAYHLLERKDVEKSVEQHAAAYYLGKKVEKLEYTDPADLSKPFRVRYEVPEAGRGVTDDNESAVVVLPEEWLLELRPLRPLGESEEAPEKRKARKNDFVWNEPFTDEWRFRVVPPEGYVAAGLPASGQRNLGPVLLSQDFRVESSGVVTATIRLTSGKERMTPAEFEAARAEVKKLAELKPFLVRFESVASQHLTAGRIREALVEYRRRIALHPKEALHHEQMARALLQAGLGDAARRQARIAVESEPDSAAAYGVLAWILQHDLIGRRFGKGFDRAGAVAAYRKALELDPKDKDIAANLAILLEHDATGRRYGDPAQVREAVVVYQRLRKEQNVRTYDSSLAIALLRSEQFAEAKQFALELPAGPQRDAILLTAIAALDGAPAAIQEASRLGDSAANRRAAIESAGRTLILLRRYEAAALLLTEAAGGAEKPGELLTLAETVKRMRRFEEIPLPPNDPATLVRKLFIAALMNGAPGAPPVASLITKHLMATEDNSEERFLEEARRGLAQTGRIDEVPPTVLLDALLPTSTIAREGTDALGYRLTANFAGAGPGVDLFVTKENGEWRIASFGNAQEPFGAEALARAERGDLDGARQWLDWARSGAKYGGGDDPLGGPLVRRFWTKGSRDGRARIRVAAAALVCEGPTLAASGKAILDDAATVRESGAAVEDVDLAQAVCAATLKAWPELDTLSAKLLAAYPASDRALGLRTLALIRLDRFADAEKIARDRLAKAPDDVTALQALISVLLSREDFAGVEGVSLDLIDRGRATEVDYNNLAWNGLFTKVTDKTIDWAQKGAGQPGARYAAGLHTLAAVYAEAGRSVQSREALLESLRVKGAESPEPHDWYVLGRIAENYGETETARADYARVTKPEDSPLGGSTYRLAEKRLTALGAPPASTPP